MILRLNLPLIVGVISFVVFMSTGVWLYRYTHGLTGIPFSGSNKNGAMYFVGEHKVGVNQPFKLKVMINTAGQSVNAAGLQLRFDPNKIQINEISTLNSFCQYYPEKKFDNRQGLLSLACGSPSVLKGENELIEMNITPLSVGSTTIYLSSTSKILLSDGKGTNILKDYPNWEVQIVTRL